MNSESLTLKRSADADEADAVTKKELPEESPSTPPPAAADAPLATGTVTDENSPLASVPSKSNSNRKNSNKGRHGDPRMHRAVAARLVNPELSLLEALLEGGFTFPEGTEGSGKSDRNIFDSDGVLLCQRKNQLSRRLRLAKKRQQASRTDGSMFSSNGGQGQGDSRSLQNMLLNGQLPISGGGEMPMMPSHQFAPPFFPGQPGAMDPSGLNGNDKRQMDNNLDQYLQQTARSMGLRPEQLQQSLRSYPNQAAMFPGFAPPNGMPFQQFPVMPNQQPPYMAAAMDQQRNGNGGMENINGVGSTPTSAQQQQNIQMPAIMAMQQQQQQYNSDIGRMLLNRSLLMNVMEQQQHQHQGQGQPQGGQAQPQPQDKNEKSV
jgi:hypothetical protein